MQALTSLLIPQAGACNSLLIASPDISHSADVPSLLNFSHTQTCYQLSIFSFGEARARRSINSGAVIAFLLSISKVAVTLHKIFFKIQ